MRAAVAVGAAILVGAGIWLFFNRLAPGGEPDIVGIAGPDGSAARSVVVLDGADGGARTSIRVFEPRDGARAELAKLEAVTFRWASVPDASGYLFVANNEFGELVWRGHARDTVITLPQKVAIMLVPGDRIKWIVQVPHLSASSDLHRLEIQ